MIELFESILLLEKKDHFIFGPKSKCENLMNGQKKELVEWFDKWPDLESLIDWNKSFIGEEDYLIVKRATEGRKETYKHSGKLSALFKKFKLDEYAVLKETPSKIYVVPLSYRVAVFMNSFNCGGIGSRWCIGTKDNQNWWTDYNTRDCRFIMYLNTETHEKLMVQYEPEQYEIGEEVITLWVGEDEIYQTDSGEELMIDFRNDKEGLNIIANIIDIDPKELLQWINSLDEYKPDYYDPD